MEVTLTAESLEKILHLDVASKKATIVFTTERQTRIILPGKRPRSTQKYLIRFDSDSNITEIIFIDEYGNRNPILDNEAVGKGVQFFLEQEAKEIANSSEGQTLATKAKIYTNSPKPAHVQFEESYDDDSDDVFWD
ncbi:MAG: hypothetical protein OXR68_01405 [Alphaproteobacteria bacterium]|nr:hypothetical protein [Alphaproteobacteria bacterium]MDD9919268.1 hypothetical protein [Alphaproteobacteria bacterium]